MKAVYYTAYTDFWWGSECAIHRDRDPAPFARWRRVSGREYRRLWSSSFRVRKAGKETTRGKAR